VDHVSGGSADAAEVVCAPQPEHLLPACQLHPALQDYRALDSRKAIDSHRKPYYCCLTSAMWLWILAHFLLVASDSKSEEGGGGVGPVTRLSEPYLGA
jgi:hypothetical protein